MKTYYSRVIAGCPELQWPSYASADEHTFSVSAGQPPPNGPMDHSDLAETLPLYPSRPILTFHSSYSLRVWLKKGANKH